MVDFGNTLKTLHLRKNMTQAQLAQKFQYLYQSSNTKENHSEEACYEKSHM